MMHGYEVEDSKYESVQRDRQREKDRIGLVIKALLALLVLITLHSFAGRIAYRISVPMETLSGEPWNQTWTVIGKKLGTDEDAMPENWALDYNQEISVADKVSMALYGHGTPEVISYIDRNDKESERNRYDAGFYLLTRGSGGPEKADVDLNEWRQVLSNGCTDFHPVECITVEEGELVTVYDCFAYTYAEDKSEDYHQGVLACTVVSGWAFFCELDWNDSLGWDEKTGHAVIENLLSSFHYAR